MSLVQALKYKKYIISVTKLIERCGYIMKKRNDSPKNPGKSRPALTPEARENQLISLATDLAEQQLRDGTASSQVITHYLKLGSTREKLEQDILSNKKDLLAAKTECLESSKRVEELYANAIDAMRKYGGQNSVSEEYDDEYDDYD